MGKKKYQKRSNQSVWWVAGLAVAAVAVLIGMSIYSSASRQKTAVASDAELHADRNAMGRSDAKVTLVEWSDYL